MMFIFSGGKNTPLLAASGQTWWQHTQVSEWLIVPQPQQWDPQYLHQYVFSDLHHHLWKRYHTQREQWLWLSRHRKPGGPRERAGYKGGTSLLSCWVPTTGVGRMATEIVSVFFKDTDTELRNNRDQLLPLSLSLDNKLIIGCAP